MLVFDTNVLVYAVHRDSPFHLACFNFLEESRDNPEPAFLTWGICYEFMRVTTHPNVLGAPMSFSEAWEFLEDLIESSGFEVLGSTPRHAAVLSEILEELPDLRGSISHDLHTAVLMREHGITRICSRDSDFRRFPFLTVIDPVN
ncbi:MAG: PIN domain-containing protein [Dehalococcoidia bacterium]|nr:PIN domain-containing protein [Dehalococcoidia bacterium]